MVNKLAIAQEETAKPESSLNSDDKQQIGKTRFFLKGVLIKRTWHTEGIADQ